MPAQFPRLSGQFAEYIAAQLTAFREGKRTGKSSYDLLGGHVPPEQIGGDASRGPQKS